MSGDAGSYNLTISDNLKLYERDIVITHEDLLLSNKYCFKSGVFSVDNEWLSLHLILEVDHRDTETCGDIKTF